MKTSQIMEIGKKRENIGKRQENFEYREEKGEGIVLSKSMPMGQLPLPAHCTLPGAASEVP